MREGEGMGRRRRVREGEGEGEEGGTGDRTGTMSTVLSQDNDLSSAWQLWLVGLEA